MHLSEHIHDFDKNIDFNKDIFSKAEKELMEDYFICLLETKSPTGLNKELNYYATEIWAYLNSLT